MDIKRYVIVIFLLASCNTTNQSQALCEEAASLTNIQLEQELVGRKLIWHATVDDVIFTSDDTYLVIINDNHIEVKYVPQQIALKLSKGDPFNFIGTITRLNELCFGEVQFNEPYQ